MNRVSENKDGGGVEVRKDTAPPGSDRMHLARVKDSSREKSQEVERAGLVLW